VVKAFVFNSVRVVSAVLVSSLVVLYASLNIPELTGIFADIKNEPYLEDEDDYLKS